MTTRWGSWRDSYDPDETASLPRPFRLGEEVRKGRARHQLFIPKAPDVRTTNPLKAYQEPNFFTLPHLHKKFKHTKALSTQRYSLSKAAYQRLKAEGVIVEGKGAGVYVRWVAGYKQQYDPLSGKLINVPIYKYAKVPDFKALYLQGEAGVNKALRWLYRYDRALYWTEAKKIAAWRQDVIQKGKHEYQAYLQNMKAWYSSVEAKAKAHAKTIKY